MYRKLTAVLRGVQECFSKLFSSLGDTAYDLRLESSGLFSEEQRSLEAFAITKGLSDTSSHLTPKLMGIRSYEFCTMLHSVVFFIVSSSLRGIGFCEKFGFCLTMTVFAVALCCLAVLSRVEAKCMVGVVILELYAKQMENLAQLLANTQLEKCPAHRSNPQLAKLMKSLNDFKTVGQSSISTHLPKLARGQWKIYLQPISENMQKLDSWVTAAPESPCLNEHVLEVFAVQSADIVGGLQASTNLLKKLTDTLDGSDDYRSGFFTAYQTYLSELVDTLEKVKNDETVICAVITEDGAPAYSKILGAVINFLTNSHPAIITQEKNIVTGFLTANSVALNGLITGADTHAKSAMSKAVVLKEKCTDKPNPLVPVAISLERAWEEVNSKTKSVLQHCTMVICLGIVTTASAHFTAHLWQVNKGIWS
ncbi:hypothetical protein CRM22_007812 [Opisthorchis felineus]|uniref:Uncharacterized protein n=1 Tax=Opisthorchis felineus TaxID=147828 RepID=A0A4S2LEI8_OPIFE|nr:hypothetical protein CRM22_007812 [Opisthorchis felineus]